MPDERTSVLRLPLPHPDHLLVDDVLRLREALIALDSQVADKVAASDVLSLLAQEASTRAAADEGVQSDLANAQVSLQTLIETALQTSEAQWSQRFDALAVRTVDPSRYRQVYANFLEGV